jgi:transposase
LLDRGLEEVWRNLFKGVSRFFRVLMRGNFMTNQKVIKQTRRDREFRMDAAKMIVESGRSIAEVARELGHSYPTVASWVKAYRAAQAAPKLSPVEVQLKAAQEENRKLKVQVEFLKKTMAYFVELPK